METHGPVAMNRSHLVYDSQPGDHAGSRTSGRMAPHLTTLPKEVVANHPDAPWRSSESETEGRRYERKRLSDDLQLHCRDPFLR
jgi:hypothetical protein